MFPKRIVCSSCEDEIELDEDERALGEITCPSCSNVIKETNLELPITALVEYGGFWRRFGANTIDALVFFPVAIAAAFVMITLNFWLILPIQILSGILGAAYTTFMHAWYGATLGKMATGLSVRKTSLYPISWDEAVKRNSVDYVFLMITAIGNISTFLVIPREELLRASIFDMSPLLQHYQSPLFSVCQTFFGLWFWSEIVVLLFNEKKRAIHDLIAGTVVVVKTSLPVGQFDRASESIAAQNSADR